MNISEIVNGRRDEALEGVSSIFDHDPRFERIPFSVMSEKDKAYLRGWKTVYPIAPNKCFLEVYLPKFFPDCIPDIFVSGEIGNFYLKTPHIEKSGRICTISNSAAIDSERPTDVVAECLQRALEIISNPNEDDFRDEALSYWVASGKKHTYVAYACDTIRPSTDLCVIGIKKKTLVVASTEDSAKSWFNKWKGPNATFETVAPCIVVHLPTPLVPSEYPSNLSEVRCLLRTHGKGMLELFDEHIAKSKSLIGIVLSQKSPEGEALMGVVTFGQSLDRNTKLIHGFRPGVAPASLVIGRSGKKLSNTLVSNLHIIRTDAEWIHSRGGIGTNMSGKKVTLIGCGSLGGYVAHLLARAGIGSICLLDNDRLSWENVGRHLLGASDVGHSKSESIGRRLSNELPHIKVSHFDGDWRDWIGTPVGLEEFET